MLRYDPTRDHIQRLKPEIRDQAIYLINAARQDGYPLIITSSTRNILQQGYLVATGKSRTLASYHREGLAFDVDLMGLDRNAIPRWFWDVLGPFGESLGLRWGGRFKTFWDPGHFELPLV